MDQSILANVQLLHPVVSGHHDQVLVVIDVVVVLPNYWMITPLFWNNMVIFDNPVAKTPTRLEPSSCNGSVTHWSQRDLNP